MVSFFGVDYYPEHWPEARWEEDARLMQEMGITAVRLGEFSWVKFEPREGEYHFEWLDRALDVLYRHGIRAILGTPTAARVADRGSPRIFARGQPRLSCVLRRTASRLSEQRGLSCSCAQFGNGHGGALRQPPGGLCVADRQRAGQQPRRSLLLRKLHKRLPRLAAKALWRH